MDHYERNKAKTSPDEEELISIHLNQIYGTDQVISIISPNIKNIDYFSVGSVKMEMAMGKQN